jgi:hypothetical protein
MDFDKIEHLLKTTDFDRLSGIDREMVLSQLTEMEYCSMRELYLHAGTHTALEIQPSPRLKLQLDKALQARQPLMMGRFRMPLYQVAAIALVFFVVGTFINHRTITQDRIVTQRVKEIRYIDRPVEHVKYITIHAPAKTRTNNQPGVPSLSVSDNSTIVDTHFETNPEIIRQQEIAMTNIQRALNDKNGVSIGSDTVLQKMMVTVY